MSISSLVSERPRHSLRH